VAEFSRRHVKQFINYRKNDAACNETNRRDNGRVDLLSSALNSFKTGVSIMEHNEARQAVFDLLSRLKDELKSWTPLQTAADVRAYDVLGRIYEDAAVIDAERLKRVVLEDMMRSHAEVGPSKKWSPGGKPTTELLVTYLLGLKAFRSRKHNWVSALAHAAECDVKPSAEEFRKWISSAEVGGIDGAVAAHRGETLTPKKIDLSEVAASLVAAIETPKTVELHIATAAPAGLAVLVVQRKDDGNAFVLKESSDESELKRVFADLHITKKTKARNPIQIANIEREAVGRLTGVVQKLATKKLLSVNDGIAFTGAVKKLMDVPELREKYFNGEPDYGVRFDDMGKYSIISTINEDYHLLDPGRYIGGARERLLIPYPFDPANDAENRRQRNSYLESLKKVRPKRPEPRSDQPTLAAFIEDDEIESADLQTEEA